MATKKFKCKVCGYIHEGDKAPEKCPVCQAPASEFIEITDKKKGLNTNGNGYTIIYASVMVIIVAFLLAFVSQSLKPIQDVNLAVDKKKQILASLNIRNIDNAQVEAEYSKVIVADEIINEAGEVVNPGTEKEDAGFLVSTKEIGPDNLPVYICDVNGETKYVFPLAGKGLWGAIWGYVALDADKNTVYCAYFSHESVTAGLGSIITEYENF